MKRKRFSKLAAATIVGLVVVDIASHWSGVYVDCYQVRMSLSAHYLLVAIRQPRTPPIYCDVQYWGVGAPLRLLPQRFHSAVLGDGVSVPIWYCTFLTFAVCLFVRLRKADPSRCAACGYDLTGNTSGRCPECGGAAERIA